MSDSLISRSGADTESYQLRGERKRSVGSPEDVRSLMADALISEAPVLPDEDAPAAKPEITPEMVQENLRRVRAGAVNTLITINPDGTRSYKHDIVVRDSDGIRDTLATDRGRGTSESLDMLAKEGAVKVDGILAPSRPRDASGRFAKKG